MWPMRVVLVYVEVEDAFEVAASDDQHPVHALSTHRADEAFRVGIRTGCPDGVRITWRPSDRNTSSKAPLNLVSRSRIRKRRAPMRMPMTRLRACWTTQEPVGCAVTPAR